MFVLVPMIVYFFERCVRFYRYTQRVDVVSVSFPNCSSALDCWVIKTWTHSSPGSVLDSSCRHIEPTSCIVLGKPKTYEQCLQICGLNLLNVVALDIIYHSSLEIPIFYGNSPQIPPRNVTRWHLTYLFHLLSVALLLCSWPANWEVYSLFTALGR